MEENNWGKHKTTKAIKLIKKVQYFKLLIIILYFFKTQKGLYKLHLIIGLN